MTKNELGNNRIIEKEKKLWFVGKGIAEALGYSETNAMTKGLDEEDFMSAKLSGMNMKGLCVNNSKEQYKTHNRRIKSV